jgi:4-amino-4-deoxy-L-arabinose transferase-like glycosyltransferase
VFWPQNVRRLCVLAVVPIDRLIAKLIDPAHREWAAVIVIVVYVLGWTLYGVLAKMSQDVHPDMVEVFGWSRDLALGYKHPPLSAWLTAIWFTFLPATDLAFYLLAMTVAGVALWTAWCLAGDYLSPQKRVAALGMLMLVPFYNFHALKFNANTILMPLWAATTLCFLRSFERRSAVWAAFAGLFAAGAMLGKYWSIFLIMGLGATALLDERRAAYFRSSAPWITIAVGAIVLAPHIAWLMNDNLVAFEYALRFHGSTEEQGAALTVAKYLLGALAYVAFPLLLVFVWQRPDSPLLCDILLPANPSRRLAAAAFWGPLLLPVLAPILADFQILGLWSMSGWTLLPVVVLSSPQITVPQNAIRSLAIIVILLLTTMIAAAPVIARSIFNNPRSSGAFHFRLLAERVAAEWKARSDKPLRIVAGEEGLPYGVSFYDPAHPLPYDGMDGKAALWLAEAQLKRDGFVAICRTHLPCLEQVRQHGYRAISLPVTMAGRYKGAEGHVENYNIVIVAPAQ